MGLFLLLREDHMRICAGYRRDCLDLQKDKGAI